MSQATEGAFQSKVYHQPLQTGKTRQTAFLRRYLSLICAIVLLMMAGWKALLIAGDALIDESKLSALESRYSSHNSAGAVTASKTAYVYAKEMPDYVRDAFVAIEDHRFRQHDGVDLIALGRALWIDLVYGEKVQGGSTITMQLARNLFLSHEKTMSRKAKEMLIAINLEHRYTKDQLLEMYLNSIYFGHGKYGIEEAANWYFGKTTRAHDSRRQTVSLGEAAILASLPKAPESYSPIKHLDKAKFRQKIVLERMFQLHYLSEEEKAAALKEKTTLADHPFRIDGKQRLSLRSENVSLMQVAMQQVRR